MEIEQTPGIDSAIDAAANALAKSRDVDYGRLNGIGQYDYRDQAQIVVDAWVEDRRRNADEQVPAGLSGVPAAPTGPDEMPLIWWSPAHGLLWRPSGYDHIENPDNKRYFYKMPADAVELRPVDDA